MDIWKTFPHPNMEEGRWLCPICLKADDKPVVLMPIYGTRVEGIEECRQIHADCLVYGVKALYWQGKQ